jgi:cyclase
MAARGYTRGLHEVGDGVYAWLQPDGSWGWSNAGLVVDGDASLLVDTLFDLRLTGEMLDAMRRAVPAAADIDLVVNTHANGDHCWGNQLVRDAEIVGSRRCAEEMAELPPSLLAALMADPPEGPTGDLVRRMFGAFDFDGIEVVPPTTTFDGELTLEVGGTEVRLIEVGPAHTRGDVVVHVPAHDVVFTGDILFNGGHPIVWAGPVANWTAACDRIVGLAPATAVRGHAPRRGRPRSARGRPRHRPRPVRGPRRGRAVRGQRRRRLPRPGPARGRGRALHPPADGRLRFPPLTPTGAPRRGPAGPLSLRPAASRAP